jgi:hypothetical protein
VKTLFLLSCSDVGLVCLAARLSGVAACLSRRDWARSARAGLIWDASANLFSMPGRL